MSEDSKKGYREIESKNLSNKSQQSLKSSLFNFAFILLQSDNGIFSNPNLWYYYMTSCFSQDSNSAVSDEAKRSHFIDCSIASKSGIVDYIFKNKPKYLLLDELDNLSRKEQTFLLNLMETGIVSETKYKRTRELEIKTSVFATSNNVEKIIEPLQTRFYYLELFHRNLKY
jgi:Sigma-54 interaction domain